MLKQTFVYCNRKYQVSGYHRRTGNVSNFNETHNFQIWKMYKRKQVKKKNNKTAYIQLQSWYSKPAKYPYWLLGPWAPPLHPPRQAQDEGTPERLMTDSHSAAPHGRESMHDLSASWRYANTIWPKVSHKTCIRWKSNDSCVILKVTVLPKQRLDTLHAKWSIHGEDLSIPSAEAK